MKLTWSELKDSIPPLNLWNFPSWEVQLTKGKKMKTIEALKKDKEETRVAIELLLTDFINKYGVSVIVAGTSYTPKTPLGSSPKAIELNITVEL